MNNNRKRTKGRTIQMITEAATITRTNRAGETYTLPNPRAGRTRQIRHAQIIKTHE